MTEADGRFELAMDLTAIGLQGAQQFTQKIK